MKEMWEKRHSSNEYIYGKKPNNFYKEEIDKLSQGKILLLGEGEGRNAIYAAKLGWDVYAYDISENAKTKALNFAESEGVRINYNVGDLMETEIPANFYDAATLIYLHLHEELREKTHQKVVTSLKSGGVVILEAFEKEQVKNDSGGPKNIDMLYSLEEIFTDFQDLDLKTFQKKTLFLDEGKYHRGEATVIRLVAQKN